MPRKVLYFQLRIAIEYQTWYQINVKVKPIYVMIRYANYLIIIFIILMKAIEMKENHRRNNGVYLKTTHISASIYHKLQKDH